MMFVPTFRIVMDDEADDMPPPIAWSMIEKTSQEMKIQV